MFPSAGAKKKIVLAYSFLERVSVLPRNTGVASVVINFVQLCIKFRLSSQFSYVAVFVQPLKTSAFFFTQKKTPVFFIDLSPFSPLIASLDTSFMR